MKAKGIFISTLLVIDTFFVGFTYGFNSREVLIVDPSLPPLPAPAAVKHEKTTTHKTQDHKAKDSKTGETDKKKQHKTHHEKTGAAVSEADLKKAVAAAEKEKKKETKKEKSKNESLSRKDK